MTECSLNALAFLFCLDTAAINAYIMYLQSPTRPAKPLTHSKFQEGIVTSMTNNFRGRKRRGRKRQPVADNGTIKKHTPTKIQTKRGKKVCIVHFGLKRTLLFAICVNMLSYM